VSGSKTSRLDPIIDNRGQNWDKSRFSIPGFIRATDLRSHPARKRLLRCGLRLGSETLVRLALAKSVDYTETASITVQL